MNESKPPEQIDPIEIEINLIQELIGENIIIILHKNGMSVMMDEEIEEREIEQVKMLSRIYAVTDPSFVLQLILMLEIWMLHIWADLEDWYRKFFLKP
jgi:hypothetical protein